MIAFTPDRAPEDDNPDNFIITYDYQQGREVRIDLRSHDEVLGGPEPWGAVPFVDKFGAGYLPRR